MKITFYKPKNGILNDFLETQLSLANLQGAELESKILDSNSFKELEKEFGTLSHYTYLFSNEEGETILIFQNPLDYIDLEKIISTLKEIN